MNLYIDITVNELDSILADIRNIENVESVMLKEKTAIPSSVLDRKANNQFEIWNTVITIVLTQLTKETFEYSKKKILEYFKKRKIKVTKINRGTRKDKRK